AHRGHHDLAALDRVDRIADLAVEIETVVHARELAVEDAARAEEARDLAFDRARKRADEMGRLGIGFPDLAEGPVLRLEPFEQDLRLLLGELARHVKRRAVPVSGHRTDLRADAL